MTQQITREQIEERLMRARLEWISLGKPDASQFEKLESKIVSDLQQELKNRKTVSLGNYKEWVASLGDGLSFAMIHRKTSPTRSIIKVSKSFYDTELNTSKYKLVECSSLFPRFEEV